MGTTCDFYIGNGPTKLRWLGSYPYDGYPEGYPSQLGAAVSARDYRRILHGIAKRLTGNACGRAGAWSGPDDGWPWRWQPSSGFGYAYTWHRGAVYVSSYGRRWCELEVFKHLYRSERGRTKFKLEYPKSPEQFPVMNAETHAPLGSTRSGVIAFIAPR